MGIGWFTPRSATIFCPEIPRQPLSLSEWGLHDLENQLEEYLSLGLYDLMRFLHVPDYSASVHEWSLPSLVAVDM